MNCVFVAGSCFVYQRQNDVHKSSSLEVYYQCSVEETHSNMVLELFCQIISEPCFDILRTQEQLGITAAVDAYFIRSLVYSWFVEIISYFSIFKGHLACKKNQLDDGLHGGLATLGWHAVACSLFKTRICFCQLIIIRFVLKKRRVFRRFLKAVSDSTGVTFCVRLLHNWEAAAWKAQLPLVEWQCLRQQAHQLHSVNTMANAKVIENAAGMLYN